MSKQTKDTSAAPRRPRSSRWFRRGGILLALFILIVLALALAIDHGWQRARLISQITQLASDELGLPVSAEPAAGPLHRGFELRNLIIGERTTPLLRADSVSLSWTLRALLDQNEHVIESVRVVGAEVTIKRDGSRAWTPLKEFQAALAARSAEEKKKTKTSTKGTSARRLLLRKFSLEQANVEVVLDQPLKTAQDRPSQTVRMRFQADGSLNDLRIEIPATQPESAAQREEPPATLADSVHPGKGTLTARLTDLDSGRPEIDASAHAQLALATHGLDLTSIELDVDALGVTAAIRGMGGLEQIDALSIQADAPDLASLNPLGLFAQPIKGRLSTQADFSGPPTALKGSAHLTASDLEMDGLLANELKMDLTAHEALDLRQPDLGSAHLAFKVMARGADPGPIVRNWIPAGRSDLDLEGELATGRIKLMHGELRHPDLSASARGIASAENIEELNLTFSTERIAPWLRAWEPNLPLRGALRGTAQFKGSLRDLSGRITLDSNNLILSQKSLGIARAEIDRVPGQPAQVSLSLGQEDARHLTFDASIDPKREHIDFSGKTSIGTWTSAWPGQLKKDLPIEGDLTLRGFAENKKGGPLFAFDLISENTTAGSTKLGRITLDAARTSKNAVAIKALSIDGESGEIALTRPIDLALKGDHWSFAEAPFSFSLPEEPNQPGTLIVSAAGQGAEPASFEAELDGLPMTLLERLRPASLALPGPLAGPMKGRMKGRAHWRALREKDWTNGQLEWTEPRLGNVRFDRIEMRWTGRPQTIDLELDTHLGAAEPLSLHAQIGVPILGEEEQAPPLAERLSLEAELRDWDLSLLESFTPDWMRQVAGRVSGSVNLKQTPFGLDLRGRTEITEGSFDVPLLRQRFSPISGSITLGGQRLSIDALQIGQTGADAQLLGALDFSAAGSPHLEGKIQFDRFPLSRSSAAHTDILGQIDLEGTLEHPKLTGALALADAKIGVPAEDDPVRKEIRIATRTRSGQLVEPGDDQTAAANQSELDLEVTFPESTRVRGQGANLYIEGAVRATQKPGSAARVTGQARVVNGTYTFQGRTFEVRRGRVTFTGDEQLDPVIDVEARHPVSDIIAIVALSGRLSAPIVRLTSEPPLPDQDVLSYLLFGRAASEVAATSNAGFGAAAARLVAGVAEAELRGILGDAMPVDSIEIGADAAGNTNELGLGKYLGPNLFFRYVRVLGDEPSDRVGVEYRINDTFSVGSSVSTTGDAGLDFILRHDF